VEADLAQLLAKFFALVVRLQSLIGSQRFQIPLVVGMLAGFLSAPLGLPLKYLNEGYAPSRRHVCRVLPAF
jgi:hypothetical protein